MSARGRPPRERGCRSARTARRRRGQRRTTDQRRENELSYADAIHVAIAALLDCEALHTDDSDFEQIEEVDAVVH